jgi:hypothetical protein
MPNTTNAENLFRPTIGNKTADITNRISDISNYLSASVLNTEDAYFGNLIQLTPISPLPSGVPTGSIAVSGSAGSVKFYVYTGVTGGSGVAGWLSASLG